MKKLLIVIFVLLMILSGCSSSEGTLPPTPAEKTQETSEVVSEPSLLPEPTAEPVPEETPEPTPEPTVEPTPEPTPEPTQAPAQTEAAKDISGYQSFSMDGLTVFIPKDFRILEDEPSDAKVWNRVFIGMELSFYYKRFKIEEANVSSLEEIEKVWKESGKPEWINGWICRMEEITPNEATHVFQAMNLKDGYFYQFAFLGNAGFEEKIDDVMRDVVSKLQFE